MSDYVGRQVAEFHALVSHRVEEWSGVESAIDEGPPPGFAGPPRVPCLQLWMLVAQTDTGPRRIVTYQNDTVWGLCLDHELIGDGPFEGIYRERQLEELPVGVVHDARVRLDDTGDLAEVLLTVGGKPLLLMAGEIHPTWTDELRFVRGDEEVLVFTEPGDADALPWIPRRIPFG